MATIGGGSESLDLRDLNRPQRVAVVVAGAGARGGYEAGVLSVLLEQLETAGIAPSLFVGTSAGAINATLFAATAHLPATEQGELVLEVWRGIQTGDVFRSPVLTGLGSAGRWAGQLLRLPGVRLTNLLDTAPLCRTADEAVDWNQLRANIDSGLTELAVVTTSGADNRTVVFVDRSGAGSLPPSDDDRPIDYMPARIEPSHVLASAAIPVVFPPVRVPPDPTIHGRWYLDGGVRLNTPLKPALSLDADAVVIVATHPAIDRASDIAHTRPEEPPDVDDTLVRLMDAALVDRMVEDVRTLAKVNVLVAAAQERCSPYELDGKTVVPFLAVGPEDRGTLGLLANEVFGRRRSALGGALRLARDPSMRLLGRVLGGDGSRRGDLLSYLFFDPEFMAASIELGRKDAAAAFDGTEPGEIPWRIRT